MSSIQGSWVISELSVAKRELSVAKRELLVAKRESSVAKRHSTRHRQILSLFFGVVLGSWPMKRIKKWIKLWCQILNAGFVARVFARHALLIRKLLANLTISALWTTYFGLNFLECSRGIEVFLIFGWSGKEKRRRCSSHKTPTKLSSYLCWEIKHSNNKSCERNTILKCAKKSFVTFHVIVVQSVNLVIVQFIISMELRPKIIYGNRFGNMEKH